MQAPYVVAQFHHEGKPAAGSFRRQTQLMLPFFSESFAELPVFERLVVDGPVLASATERHWVGVALVETPRHLPQTVAGRAFRLIANVNKTSPIRNTSRNR
jgi:hypothetical protein